MPFVWTKDCQSAFEEVKRLLVSAPLLQPPDWEKEFLLWTDASLLGLGAVLEQEITEGSEHLLPMQVELPPQLRRSMELQNLKLQH